MKMKNPFQHFTKFEWALWVVSCILIIILFFANVRRDGLTLLASLIGVTALMFLAKGDVTGQILTIVFSVLYAIISFRFRYFGEMITYVGMTAPMAALAAFSWLRNPYVGSKKRDVERKNEVEIAELNGRKIVCVAVLTVIVTIGFYHILKYFDTANLAVSTVSITTSFAAASLTFLRSPYYALAYACNDIVLILLWIMASVADIVFLPMVLCFIIFLVNDLYGFVNWQRMRKRQRIDR